MPNLRKSSAFPISVVFQLSFIAASLDCVDCGCPWPAGRGCPAPGGHDGIAHGSQGDHVWNAGDDDYDSWTFRHVQRQVLWQGTGGKNGWRCHDTKNGSWHFLTVYQQAVRGGCLRFALQAFILRISFFFCCNTRMVQDFCHSRIFKTGPNAKQGAHWCKGICKVVKDFAHQQHGTLDATNWYMHMKTYTCRALNT